MKLIAIAIVGLLLSAVAAVLVAAPNAQGGTLINSSLEEKVGSTTMLGGGNYVMVRFGTDAAFGVVYGNATNPNSVYIVAMKARYLGVAQVYDQAGNQIASNRPVKIFTMYAVRLDDIIEFRDSNNNGLADYIRYYNTATNNFTGYRDTDQFYKKVDLKTSWTRGNIVRANGTAFRSWTFNVSATNLPYIVPLNFSGGGTGTPLPLVRFTFHLNASLEQVSNATVPQWKITVGGNSGSYYVTDFSRLQNLTVNGKVVHYDLKWDQLIQGWTIAGGNNRPRLLLEFHSVVGNFIPAPIADTWMQGRWVNRTGDAGVARYQTSSGIRTVNDTTGGYSTVQGLSSPYLDFGGNWTRISRTAWVTNSTVDGTTQPLYGQVMGGWRIAAMGESGQRFFGFVLLAGFSFKWGNTIAHDPEVTADVQADLELPGAGLPFGGLLLIAGVAAAVIIGVLLLLFLVVFKRRRRGVPPPMG